MIQFVFFLEVFAIESLLKWQEQDFCVPTLNDEDIVDYISLATYNYSYFAQIPTSDTNSSVNFLHKVRIPISGNKVGISAWLRTILELPQFLICGEHIW